MSDRAHEASRTIAIDELLAMTDPSSMLADALSAYLERSSASGVYEQPSAFREFIDNASNPPLYAATIQRLNRFTEGVQSLLDFGCGDGRVTAEVLRPEIRRIDLVEPSAELLGSAEHAVLGSAAAPAGAQRRDLDLKTHNQGVAQMLASSDDRWDLVQSTFAAHTLKPAERSEVLSRLTPRCQRLVIVDFDVPTFEDRSLEHAEYAIERYERGLAEYSEWPEVASGFLMPVLVGQFDPEQPRHTFEQSAQAWAADMAEAGFTDVEVEPVFDYWWAPAFLITGCGSSGG